MFRGAKSVLHGASLVGFTMDSHCEMAMDIWSSTEHTAYSVVVSQWAPTVKWPGCQRSVRELRHHSQALKEHTAHSMDHAPQSQERAPWSKERVPWSRYSVKSVLHGVLVHDILIWRCGDMVAWFMVEWWCGGMVEW